MHIKIVVATQVCKRAMNDRKNRCLAYIRFKMSSKVEIREFSYRNHDGQSTGPIVKSYDSMRCRCEACKEFNEAHFECLL